MDYFWTIFWPFGTIFYIILICFAIFSNLYKMVQTWVKLFKLDWNCSNMFAIFQTCLQIDKTCLKLIKFVWNFQNLSEVVQTELVWYCPFSSELIEIGLYLSKLFFSNPEHILTTLILTISWLLFFFLQGAGNLNNANANELNVGDDGQWNPMEWDR